LSASRPPAKLPNVAGRAAQPARKSGKQTGTICLGRTHRHQSLEQNGFFRVNIAGHPRSLKALKAKQADLCVVGQFEI
jgi:hypothetical protein